MNTFRAPLNKYRVALLAIMSTNQKHGPNEIARTHKKRINSSYVLCDVEHVAYREKWSVDMINEYDKVINV